MPEDSHSQVVSHRDRKAARACLLLAPCFLLLALAPFYGEHIVRGLWPVAFISFFVCLALSVAGLIFQQRAKKTELLFAGRELLARWHLEEPLLRAYTDQLAQRSQSKNNGIMVVITFFFVIISVPFIFFLEADERLGFLTIMGGVWTLVLVSSQLLPRYYRYQNRHGDGLVLLGGHFAYINGYLHNWDFPLSGLQQVKVMKNPFYGLKLTYYYTDRTLRHSHELQIPAPEDIDLRTLVNQIRQANQ